MTILGWTIIGIGALAGILRLVVRSDPSVLKQRENAQPEWQATGCSAGTVDSLLEVVCETFAFSPKMKSRLRPQDTLIDLYRMVYPRKPWVDQMEIETFLLQIDKDLGLPDEDIGPDTTLSEIATRIDNEAQPSMFRSLATFAS